MEDYIYVKDPLFFLSQDDDGDLEISIAEDMSNEQTIELLEYVIQTLKESQ